MCVCVCVCVKERERERERERENEREIGHLIFVDPASRTPVSQSGHGRCSVPALAVSHRLPLVCLDDGNAPGRVSLLVRHILHSDEER